MYVGICVENYQFSTMFMNWKYDVYVLTLVEYTVIYHVHIYDVAYLH